MNVKRVVLPGLLAFTALLCVTGYAGLPSYSFIDFEAGSGWKIGPFPGDKPALRLVQGDASIIGYPERDSRQALQLGPSKPFPALFIDASAATKGLVAYCEILARPFALDQNTDEEFFDFGGAVLGFFREGNYGEVRALFANSEKESVWITTGMRFDLDAAGLSARWLRLTVKLDRRTGRWDLRVNGVQVLSGLQAVPGQAAGLALWLYGDESHPFLFDDILLSTEEPGRLEKMIAWQNERRARLQSWAASQTTAKTVVQTKRNNELRQSQPNLDALTRKLTAPILRDWNLIFQDGGVTTRSGSGTKVGAMTMGIAAYAPQFDEHNNPLPATLTIVADAELKPGADLSKLRWIVAEFTKWPDELGDIMATGDFSTGLVQTVSMPGTWAQQKASLVYVWGEGSGNDIRKHFKFKGGILPEALKKAE